MRVTCILDKLIKDLEHDEREISRATKIDIRTLKKIRENQASWSLKKSQIERLMLYAFNSGFPNGIFEIEPHPVWETFGHGPTTIFRAQKSWDAEVEASLRRFLGNFETSVVTELAVPEPSALDVDKVRAAMRETNCIFVGSPKSNLASEVAMTHMWNAEPFNPSKANRAKIPIQCLGMGSKQSDTSAVLQDSTRRGFLLDLPGRHEKEYLRVTWRNLEEYRDWTGEGSDSAVVAVKAYGSDVSRTVTSMVIAGYTGLATEVAAKQMISGDPPFSAPTSSTTAEFAGLSFRFKKAGRGTGSTLAHIRKCVSGTTQWGPSW